MESSGIFSQRYQLRRQRRHPEVNPHVLAAVKATVPAGKSIIDIGAGHGCYVRALRECGYTADGLDGTPGIAGISGGLVIQADLTLDCEFFHGCSDWGLFLEVGEHVPAALESQLLDTVSKIPTEGLIVSWATAGQRGRDHVNPHDPEWVTGEFVRRGWRLDAEATKRARDLSGRSFRDKMLVFRRGT